MKQVGRNTLVSLGSLLAAVAVTIPIVRTIDAPGQEISSIRMRVVAIEARVDELRTRQDKTDERWERILDDLSQIKERLGIVESRPSK
jgi:hypothetical protein